MVVRLRQGREQRRLIDEREALGIEPHGVFGRAGRGGPAFGGVTSQRRQLAGRGEAGEEGGAFLATVRQVELDRIDRRILERRGGALAERRWRWRYRAALVPKWQAQAVRQLAQVVDVRERLGGGRRRKRRENEGDDPDQPDGEDGWESVMGARPSVHDRGFCKASARNFPCKALIPLGFMMSGCLNRRDPDQESGDAAPNGDVAVRIARMMALRVEAKAAAPGPLQVNTVRAPKSP